MRNNTAMTVIIALVVGAAAFYAGMQYQKSQRPSFAGGQGGQFSNRAFGGGQGRGNFQGARPVIGEILSQDDKSITVKMQDGSTKIVILSGNTTINKATSGSKEDLKTGERVSAFGTINSDGSITAQNIAVGGGMMFRGGLRNTTPQPTK